MKSSPNMDSFLDSVAARTPTPGGGAVAAAAGALGSALARMVAAYSSSDNKTSIDDTEAREFEQQLMRTDELLRGLLVEDCEAYEQLAAASKRGKAGGGGNEHFAIALGVAVAVPMQIAAAACETVDLIERLLGVANKNLVSDLGVAAVLAEASVRAAAYMVYVNAYSLADAEMRQKSDHEIDQLVVRASRARTRIDESLRDRM